MGKLHSLILTVRLQGFAGVLRAVRTNIRSCNIMVLLRKEYDPADVQKVTVEEGFVMRRATREDIPAIAQSWPEEFKPKWHTESELWRTLNHHFDSDWPCFVTVHRDSRIYGAMWCRPWTYDSALAPAERGRSCYEISSLFTIPEARGKSMAARLILYAMEQLAHDGMKTAYSRIQPDRTPSLRTHEKIGFQRIGILTDGRIFGRFYCSLKRETQAAPV
ncbi:GNAT family N-acetyltransferase [bacterium]|nr:GNAT family N-acetyltransferase [bacterium]